MPQRRSECKRYGISKYEDKLEQWFIDLGLPIKRQQIFCFLCLSMFTNPKFGEYPDMCDHCGNSYIRGNRRDPKERSLYCMPDIVIEDPARHGKAVIFVNGKQHEKVKAIAKDKAQIEILRKNNWKVFIIDNEEVFHLEHVKHANRRFLALGIYRAMIDLDMYRLAYANEKEYPALQK